MELAIVLPVLLAILFGLMYFGFVFAQELALGNGARQAARFGAVPGQTCTDIVGHFRANSSTIGMDATSSAEVTVVVELVDLTSGTATNPCGGSPVCEGAADDSSVRVTATMVGSQPISIPFIGDSTPAGNPEGVGVFRCEYS